MDKQSERQRCDDTGRVSGDAAAAEVTVMVIWAVWEQLKTHYDVSDSDKITSFQGPFSFCSGPF